MNERYAVQQFHGHAPNGSRVFLMRFRPELVQDGAFMTMFLGELSILTVLRHRNVARLIEVGSDESERFLVFEYVDGVTLIGLPPLDRDVAAWIIAEACAGLQAVHERGIVHRDVRPSNIMLTTDGAVKVIDIAMARATRDRSMVAGGLWHRFTYVSPEGVMGKQIDHRSDIWSLGVVLYELSAHRRLFVRDTDFDTLKEIAMGPPPVLDASFPPVLDAIVLTALERDPDDRYQTAAEMRAALLAVIGEDERSGEIAALLAALGP